MALHSHRPWQETGGPVKVGLSITFHKVRVLKEASTVLQGAQVALAGILACYADAAQLVSHHWAMALQCAVAGSLVPR